jgi:hypothetical protein
MELIISELEKDTGNKTIIHNSKEIDEFYIQPRVNELIIVGDTMYIVSQILHQYDEDCIIIIVIKK